MKSLLALLAWAALPIAALADNWPAWRGSTGQGHCAETNLLLKWGEKENVKWKVPLAHQGNSTPVVWGDRIFMTQANTGGSVRSLLCIDRKDGRVLWQKDIKYPYKEWNWNPNWYGNASPCTDGERVIVSLGSAGMFCYDFEGKELWKRTDLGYWEHNFGNASSPVIYQDLCFLWCGPNALPEPPDGKNKKTGGRNFLLAVKKKTGETVWEKNEKNGSWSTPIIAKVDGQDQLVNSFVPYLKAYDPQSGKDLWFCEGLAKYVYSSPLVANGYGVGLSGYHGPGLGVKLGGSGDITKDRLWVQGDKNPQRVGSGVIIGEHLYHMEENGLPQCFELKTGKDVWKVPSRPGGTTTWGSVVHADGKLYVLMRNAETLVFAASPKYEHLATNQLGAGEQTNSSIAISNGEFFIRTFKHLYCISPQK